MALNDRQRRLIHAAFITALLVLAMAIQGRADGAGGAGGGEVPIPQQVYLWRC